MATYFNGGPENQHDGLQTLYLMNPTYLGYSDSPAAAPNQTNMVYLNSIPQPPPTQQQQQHFVGIPLQDSNRPPPPANLSSVQHYNLWTPPNPDDFQQPQLAHKHLSLSLSGSGDDAKVAGLRSVLMGSKYLKAAQQLLDEVASVGKAETDKASEHKDSATKTAKDEDGEAGSSSGKRPAADLSAAERQELQMKKAKLVNMLDEVEQRYRQYHHQMQIVVSSFEAVAGFGSARTYTALALRTISKQFRCLRDAITGQIRATSRSLGEKEGVGGGSKSVGSRLRFVDHQLRQQRALQQLGMIQHNAWRPQRGLPERAVSVLRAWLFEHFLHPYPKDSDKHLLAKQTGLTRSQVSNWFINARVRLWKPMVEEMYLEETKEQNGDDDDSTSKSEASKHSASKSNTPITEQNNVFNSMQENNQNNDPEISQVEVPSSGFESMMQQSYKRARSDEESIQQNTIPNLMGMDMKQDELSNRELLMKFMDQGGGFGSYPIGEIARFNHEQFTPRFLANGVSLTLGLPHCETLSLLGSQQPSYISNESIPVGRRIDMGSEEGSYFSLNSSNEPSASHTPNGYESISIQNRKRFAAQLLPDYVA